MGGSLIEDIPSQVNTQTEHRYVTPGSPSMHQVDILGESYLSRAYPNNVMTVNSYHHQAVGRLAPGLRAPEGTLTRRSPTDAEWKDIRYGWPIARSMGSFDIGQCLIVREGMVMAVECLEGTDATIRRGGELGGDGCIAIKMVKPMMKMETHFICFCCEFAAGFFPSFGCFFSWIFWIIRGKSIDII